MCTYILAQKQFGSQIISDRQYSWLLCGNQHEFFNEGEMYFKMQLNYVFYQTNIRQKW